MKKILCALLALTLIVSPTGQNACSAAETDTTETTKATEAELASAPDTDVSQDAMQEHVEDSAPVEELDATQISTNKDERFWEKAHRWSSSVLGAPIHQVTGWWQSKTDVEKKAFVNKIGGILGWTAMAGKVLTWVLPLPRHRRPRHADSISRPAVTTGAAAMTPDVRMALYAVWPFMNKVSTHLTSIPDTMYAPIGWARQVELANIMRCNMLTSMEMFPPATVAAVEQQLREYLRYNLELPAGAVTTRTIDRMFVKAIENARLEVLNAISTIARQRA